MIVQNPNNNPYPPLQLGNTVVLTVDVEDYFMSPEFVPFSSWESYSSCIHTGMERSLKLLGEYKAKATFFFVGWLAERYPEIVQWAYEQGHEIGTHTYNHTFVHYLTESQFHESIRYSLEILRGICPQAEIIGHRAPAFSLSRQKQWQFDILKEHGILYDSSINPHGTYLYGDADALRFPYRLHGLVEIPPGAIVWKKRKLPVGGGGTLRILPERYLRWARGHYQREGYPPVIYIHPWEFVPEQPRIHLPWKQQLIHWWGIRTVERKFRNLLSGNETICMRDYYERLIRLESVPRSEPIRQEKIHIE